MMFGHRGLSQFAYLPSGGVTPYRLSYILDWLVNCSSGGGVCVCAEGYVVETLVCWFIKMHHSSHDLIFASPSPFIGCSVWLTAPLPRPHRRVATGSETNAGRVYTVHFQCTLGVSVLVWFLSGELKVSCIPDGMRGYSRCIRKEYSHHLQYVNLNSSQLPGLLWWPVLGTPSPKYSPTGDVFWSTKGCPVCLRVTNDFLLLF